MFGIVLNIENDTMDEKLLCRWKFNDFNDLPNKESHINFYDTQYGNCISIMDSDKPQMTIDADRDQWGTWIIFKIGDSSYTIAQEDYTMSFIDAFIASLTKLKEITDLETKPPIFEEML